MLRKLALSGIRSRFRDYAVLFSGLVIASAVFYMFMALATNSAFLSSNSTINLTGFIFMFGEVLLAIITLVYIVYANTFLMSMRQRDYAMFMMLGAKSRKIAQLIFIETIAIGLLAAVVGTVIGVGLTAGVGQLLMSQLHTTAAHFAPLWWPAVGMTLGFFIVLFILAAFFNAGKLLRTPVLALLHAAQTPNRIKQSRLSLISQAVLAVILLAIGYWAMTQMTTLQLMAVAIALVTIVAGTYFLFNALLVALINLLKRNQHFASQQLHTFTLSQLSFRIRDYTKILAVVALLFALALGALTVGLGFAKEIPTLTNDQNAYATVTVSPDAATQQAVAKLTGVTRKVTYAQKTDGKVIYFNAGEVNAHPFKFAVWHKSGTTIESFNAATFNQHSGTVSTQLAQLAAPDQQGREIKVVDPAAFAAVNSPLRQVTTYELSDFGANYDQIKTVVTAMAKQYHVSVGSLQGQKFYYYTLINGMLSGFAFMGFFLGLAFLAMLASTLMFKILSGANYDKTRYLMLQKIGVRPAALRKSIRQEIGALYFFPGLLGVSHVLFGLQMFTTLMAHPYTGIWLPFIIFIALYALYYGLTVWLYDNIVIQKRLGSGD